MDASKKKLRRKKQRERGKEGKWGVVEIKERRRGARGRGSGNGSVPAFLSPR
jgi:hypothetical protein